MLRMPEAPPEPRYAAQRRMTPSQWRAIPWGATNEDLEKAPCAGLGAIHVSGFGNWGMAAQEAAAIGPAGIRLGVICGEDSCSSTTDIRNTHPSQADIARIQAKRRPALQIQRENGSLVTLLLSSM